MAKILGWDIGAANIKAALWSPEENPEHRVRMVSRPYEIWRDKSRLPDAMRSAFDSVTQGVLPDAMAVTMTAELSDAFACSREGVLCILETLNASFPRLRTYVFSLSGKFVPFDAAKDQPLEFAASNWLASATWVAGQIRDCLLVDVGSTTTDIIPIVGGQVIAAGRTDLDRLSTGELIYTGALRTNLAAIVQSVPVAGRFCRVASEYFAVSGDVHLVLGHLTPQEYTCATPDGRPATVEFSRNRIARLVCADSELLCPADIDEMARHIFAQQVRHICCGIEQVISRVPRLRTRPVVIQGTGWFLGSAAAASMGLEMKEISSGPGKSGMAPCVAAALLLEEHLKGSPQ